MGEDIRALVIQGYVWASRSDKNTIIFFTGMLLLGLAEFVYGTYKLANIKKKYPDDEAEQFIQRRASMLLRIFGTWFTAIAVYKFGTLIF
jgi:hypothetical protein